jgi:hypothetical protein
MSVSPTEEQIDVACKVSVVLKEESMRRVWVDLDLRIRNEPGEQVRVSRQDHGVAVPIGNEHGMVDRTKPFKK